MESQSWNPDDLLESSDLPLASSQVVQNIEIPHSPGSVTSESRKKRRGKKKLKILKLKEKLKEAKAEIKSKNTQLSHCVQFIDIVHQQFAEILSGLEVFVRCPDCDQNSVNNKLTELMKKLSSNLSGSNLERFGDSISMLQDLNEMLKGRHVTPGPNNVDNEQPSTSKNAAAQSSRQLPEISQETVQQSLSHIKTFLNLHQDRHSALNFSQEPQTPVVNHPTEVLEVYMESEPVSRNRQKISQNGSHGKLSQQTRLQNKLNSKFKAGTECRHGIDQSFVDQNACICGNVYSRKGALVEHIQNQLTKKAFKCNLCGARVSSHKVFKKHLQNKHQVEYRPNQRFDCDVCGEKFSNWDAVFKHHQNVHQGKHNRLEDIIGESPPQTATASESAGNPVINFATDNSAGVPAETFYSQPTPQSITTGPFNNEVQNLIYLDYATETNVEWSQMYP